MSSSINPNNIDGNFPVAGQPNNTQGFRDNFTNIKTNFSTAATEITDLENNGIFKSALAGTTLDNNMADNLIYAAAIRDFSAVAVQLTATSGSITVDYSAGHYQAISTTGSISLNFTNFPPSGSAGIIRLSIAITNTAYTLTLPAAVSLGTTGIQGYAASVITFAATGTYQFEFSTVDSGTTITIFDLNRPLSYYTNPVTIASTTNSNSTTSGALTVAGGVGIAGNLYIGGDIFGNVSVTDLNVGNVSASGYISAIGNITGGNVNAVGLSLSGNVVSAINSTSNITTTANVISGNVNAVGLSLSGNVLSAINSTSNITTTANVISGNVRTSGLMSATGNIIGGNLSAVNLVINRITSDDSSFVNIEDGINVTGAIDASGNITGGNLNATGTVLAQSATAIPVGGTTGAGYKLSSTANFGIFFGSGAPTLAAAQGSLYLRSDGTTTNNRMYINTDGATAWTAVTTAT
jgi:cytoskeletal protein CcmA (bactofilin family)